MKHVRSSETLNCIHEILHEFCLKSILGVIQKQTSLLETEMGGSVQVLRDRKNGYVIVELWNEDKIVTISRENFKNYTICACCKELEFDEKRKLNSKHLRSEFRLENETKRLLIIHFPQVSALEGDLFSKMCFRVGNRTPRSFWGKIRPDLKTCRFSQVI